MAMTVEPIGAGPGVGGKRARPAWRARAPHQPVAVEMGSAPLASTPSQLSVLVALTVALLADGSGRVRREAESEVSQ
jgi:hypothetical protein